MARDIHARHGVRGLFTGGTAHMLISPFTVFYYSIYDEALARRRHATATESSPRGHALVPLGAAVVGRTVETIVRMPFELVRTMMQTSDGTLSMRECMTAVATQPPTHWFRGTVPTLMRDVPFSGLYWWLYEEAKARVVLPDGWVSSGTLRTAIQSFVSGATAGLAAAILTTPADVIKTARQRHQATAGEADVSYSSILRTLREQPSVAFAGLGPRLVRVPAGLATMMAGLEAARWIFERRRLLRDSPNQALR